MEILRSSSILEIIEVVFQLRRLRIVWLWLGFGLGLGKDCYPYFSGGWVGGWVVGGIGTKAKPKFLLRALQNISKQASIVL